MINLLYCGNAKVVDGITLSLMSILKHTSDEVATYILTMTAEGENGCPITQDIKKSLDKLVKEYNANNQVYLIDVTDIFEKELHNSVNINNFYTPYCLLRLLADLVNLPSKILYLDTDTMARNDIKELYNIDLTDYEFAGVIDALGRWFLDLKYINSGVLLLNMDMIKKTGLFNKCRYRVLNKKMAFPDQNAINFYATKKKYIKAKFNCQTRIKKDTIIKHFSKSIRFIPYFHTINIKPWNITGVRNVLKIHEFDDIFEKFTTRKKQEENI